MVRPPPTRPMPSNREGLKSILTSAKVGTAAALCLTQDILLAELRLDKLAPMLKADEQLLKFLLLRVSCGAPCRPGLSVLEELTVVRIGALTGWSAEKCFKCTTSPPDITSQTTV